MITLLFWGLFLGGVYVSFVVMGHDQDIQAIAKEIDELRAELEVLKAIETQRKTQENWKKLLADQEKMFEGFEEAKRRRE